jgi:integrase
MPRKATGNLYENHGRWIARITLDATTRPKIALPTCATEEAAEARRAVLTEIAQQLRSANVPTNVSRTFLRHAAEAADGKALDKVRRTIDAVCSGEARPINDPSKPVTFRDVGERWTSGELARLYPDHVRRKVNGDDDGPVLKKHVYPLVEGVPIASFTLDDAERIMRALPHKEPATRRGYALLIHRICGLAVFPLRLIPTNPLPRGFLPSRGAPKAKACLYPEEDRKLLSYTRAPLCWRLFYGFLDREGCRAYTEAAAFDLKDVDLDRGAIKLDENKTDDPRAWALGPGVVRALRASIVLREKALGRKLQGDEPLFVDEDGRRITDGDHHADRFRAYLMGAGVDRPELFERSASRLRIRIHDLRATFITNNLANGKTETWIADRVPSRAGLSRS